MRIFRSMRKTAALIAMATFALSMGAVTKVACLGNSITYGMSINNESEKYPSQLQQLLGDDYEVRNFGCNAQTVQMLGRDNGESSQPGSCAYRNKNEYRNALAYDPDIVVLKLGTNDTKPCNWLPDSPERFRTDLNDMLDEINKKCHKPKIYLCYPIRIKQETWGINERNLHAIIDIIRSVATERNIDIINLHTAFEQELGEQWNTVFNDGVHPNAQRAAIIAKRVADAILNNNLGDPDDYLHPTVACIGGARTLANAGLANPATQAYPALLSNLLGTRYEVTNFGVSTRTILRKATEKDPATTSSSPSAAYIDTPTFQTILSQAPDIVTINLGETDSRPWNWLHQADLTADLSAMTSALLSANPSMKIFICIPPRLRDNRNNGTINGNIYATEVIPALRQAAQSLNLPIIDAAELLNDDPANYSGYFNLSAEGHRLLANLIHHTITNPTASTPVTLISSPSLTLTPNPVCSGSQVTISNTLTSPATLTLTSLTGATLQSFTLTPDTHSFTPTLPAGLYIWNLTSSATSASGKLIVR